MHQTDLFGPPPTPLLPPGCVHRPEFLSVEEEAGLLAWLGGLPFTAARYKAYEARRRVVSWGGRYDFDTNTLHEAEPVPPALWPLRSRCAQWAGVPEDALQHALAAEYAPGTPLGWHRDVPDFELVIGVSLGGEGRLRFRPWPPTAPKKDEVVVLDLAPRSIYRLSGQARWGWQHSVAPTRALRYSITFRTRRLRSER